MIGWLGIGKLVAGAAIIGGVVYGVNMFVQFGQQKQINQQLIEQNEHKDTVISELQARRAAERRLLTQERDEAMTRERAMVKQLEAIANAPPSKDGPVSPILFNALAGLPEPPTGDAVRDPEGGGPPDAD